MSSLALALRLNAVRKPRSLTQQMLAILSQFGTNAHLYVPGATVPVLGPELVTGGSMSLGAGGSAAVSGASVVAGRSYIVSIPAGVLMAITSGWTVTGNGQPQLVAANGTGAVQVFSSAGVSNFNPSVREVLYYTNHISGIEARNYLDSAGTDILDSITQVDQPVGLVLDAGKSLGPELVANGDFSNGTAGWIVPANWSVSSGALVATSAGAYTATSQAEAFVAGRTYQVSYDLTVTSGTFRVYFSGGSNALGVEYSTSGRKVDLITAVAGNNTLALSAQASGFTGSVGNISVREIPGIHATQLTTANKPMLRRGLVNLLTYSNDLSRAAWFKANSPTITATSFTRTTTAASYVNHGGPAKPASALPYTIAFVVSQGTGRYFAARMQGSYPSRVDGIFDLQTGAVSRVTVSGSFANPVATMVALGGGQYLCCVSATSDAINGIGPLVSFNANNVEVDGTDSSATSSGNIFASGIFSGAITAQQIIDAGGIPVTTTAAASSANGKYSWQFDGSNDSLSLSAPLFQMADDHYVAAGVNPATGTGDLMVVSTRGASATPIVGQLDVSGGVADAVWRDDAGTLARITAGGSRVSQNTVMSLRKVAAEKVLRVNGVQVGTNSTALGATTVTASAVGVSPAMAPASYFNGQIYPVIAIKGTVTDAQALVLERWIASQSGVTL